MKEESKTKLIKIPKIRLSTRRGTPLVLKVAVVPASQIMDAAISIINELQVTYIIRFWTLCKGEKESQMKI